MSSNVVKKTILLAEEKKNLPRNDTIFIYAALTLEMSKPIIVKADFIGFIKIKLFWGRFPRISCHVMTLNAWRVSLCSRHSNWLGDALTDQSEIVLHSDLVRHCFRSGCQQIDNLCFASLFNIDFDQVLIIESFYKCVTLEIQICWIIFLYSFTIAITICSTIAQWIIEWILKMPFWNYGKTRVEIGGHWLKFGGSIWMGISLVVPWSNPCFKVVLCGWSRLRLCRPIISQ